MDYQKVKEIAHNLRVLAESLEDAIKEDVSSYTKNRTSYIKDRKSESYSVSTASYDEIFEDSE